MRQILLSTLGALVLVACGGSAPPAESPSASSSDATEASPSSSSTSDGESAPSDGGSERQFQINDSDTAGAAHGASESKIKASATEAAMKFFVVDKGTNEAIAGIVIAMTSKASGKTFYTEETDSAGYAEVLVPVGQDYELVYLSLGRRDINAKVTITDKPNQNIKLTLRYKNNIPMRKVDKPGGGQGLEPAGFVLNGVTFDTGKASIRPESYERLASVLEYMTYKKSARIQISGHTDNVGNAAANKTLSLKRAQAVRDYLVGKGIEGTRIDAIGFGDEQPVASNDSEDGRQQNRRIEAKEL